MKPLNNYVQIEPQVREDFIATPDSTYNEVGTVISVADGITVLSRGDVVYFDSWLASKYPAGEGKFYWLVPFNEIKAYEQVPKEHLSGEVSSQVPYTGATQSGVVGAM
jgi:hypothetical protein